MAIENLTDAKIRKAKPKDKEYLLSDGGGLYLRVLPSGVKSWIFKYKSPTINKTRKKGLGLYPDATLNQARAKRLEYANLITDNIDPVEYKKQETNIKERGLFSNIVDEWLDTSKQNVTPKTRKNIRSMMLNDVEPYLINKHIKDIKHPEIVKALEIKYNKAPAMAEKLFRLCNELWKWSTTQGLCEFNILLNIHKKSIMPPRPTIHHKTITEENKLTTLFNAIYALGSTYTKANALKLLLHVPLRASNLVSLEWSYIDFEKKILTIPRENMKIKDKNLPDFSLPLTDEVISILQDQRDTTLTKKYVFPSNQHVGRKINEATLNKALKDLGFDIRLHGFRSMYRSLANSHFKEHRVSMEAREAVLDHNSQTTTQKAYTHKSNYMQELRVLLEWWSSFILKIKAKKANGFTEKLNKQKV